MIKTKTVETVEEFDESGRLLKRTVTETEEVDDNPARYVHTTSPQVPLTWPNACVSCGQDGIIVDETEIEIEVEVE